MNVKLTLQLDREVIEKAKQHAKQKRQSLSSLVQNYFTFLSENQPLEDIEISNNIKELSGLIQLETEFDHRAEYRKHIEEKYS